ncbi:MAG: ABC transporter permease [Phycisphaerales bacterium]|nr:ABC transporter permease [Phycisphaerales bacterium]
MKLSKISRVAGREFASTAMTKGFIIGALIMPAAIGALMPLVILLTMSAQPPADSGTIYILDRSADVTDTLIERLSPENVEERWAENFDQAKDRAKSMLPAGEEKIEQGIASAKSIIKSPNFRTIPAGPDADIDELKREMQAQVAADGKAKGDIETVLAIVDIDADSTRKVNDDEGYGGFQLFLRPKLNDETVSEIRGSIRWSIRERRYANAGIDRTQVVEITDVDERDSQEITEDGEKKASTGITTFIIPMVSLILLLIASMTGGQYLLTTTVEEKSNRVVEVILSACSPMELMTGKILGQMFVGLSLLVVYSWLGVFALIYMERMDLISWSTIVLIFVFFILAYFMFASLMAAIGSAVNEMREAQSLMTPVILLMMVPYFFFMPVIRAPNSMLSTVTSFIPPISPFIMIMRIASNDPPPVWQTALVILVNAVAVVVFLWFAAKVFRVGLLMFGKPPNLRTLIKWVRMA